MPMYRTTTEQRSFESLLPEIVNAIRDHVREFELGDVESAILACCETVAVKEKIGALKKLSMMLTGGDPDPDPLHHVGMLVTAEWLIWARSGAKSGTHVLAARLTDIEVRDIQEELKKMSVEDTGINVFGFIGRHPEKRHAFIPIAAARPGDDFRAVLKEALVKARRAP